MLIQAKGLLVRKMSRNFSICKKTRSKGEFCSVYDLRTNKDDFFNILHYLVSYKKGLIGFCTHLDVLGSLNEQIFTLQN